MKKFVGVKALFTALIFTLLFKGDIFANSNLVINEILPNPENQDWNGDGSTGPGQEVNDSWIEIYNKSSTSTDISGWYLDDYPGKDSSPYKISSGTSIPGNGFKVFYGSETGLDLQHTNDYARLLDSSQNEQDSHHYKDNPGNDNSYGRKPDGTGDFEKFKYGSSTAPTPGSANDPSTFDITKPSTTLSSPLSGSYHNSAITISGSSADNIGVDYVSVEYSDNNGSSWSLIKKIEGPDDTDLDNIFGWDSSWTPGTDGSYSIRVYSTDVNGNQEDPRTVTNVVYDLTAPSVSYELGTGSPPAITLSAADTNLDKIYYKWDSSTGSFTEYGGSFNALEGSHTLYYKASDKAGNLSDIKSQNISYNPETQESKTSEGESEPAVLGAQAQESLPEAPSAGSFRDSPSAGGEEEGEISPYRVLVLDTDSPLYDYASEQKKLGTEGRKFSLVILIILGLGISSGATYFIMRIRNKKKGYRLHQKRPKAGQSGPGIRSLI